MRIFSNCSMSYFHKIDKDAIWVNVVNQSVISQQDKSFVELNSIVQINITKYI